MAADYWPILDGCRICDSDRKVVSEVDDENVTNWDRSDDFILATCIDSNSKACTSSTFKLQWRDTDGGSFDDVGAGTTINFNADTVLVDGANIDEADRRCTGTGAKGLFWQAGEEVEGDNLSDAIALADDYDTEIHWGLDCSAADYSHQYEFQVYNNTEGAIVGQAGCLLTMAAAPSVYTPQIIFTLV